MDEISTEAILASLPAYFQVKNVTKEAIFGTVTSDDEYRDTLESFKRGSLQSFVKWGNFSRKERISWKTSEDHGEKDIEIPGKLQWCETLLCCYGGKPRQRESINEQTSEDQEDHAYSSKSKACPMSRTSKKIGCKAKLNARKLILYRDFRSDSSSSRAKAYKMAELKVALQSGDPCRETTLIHVQLPLPAAHSGHTVTQDSGLDRRIDKKLVDKIYECVRLGNRSTSSIRPMLRQFVENDLCEQVTVRPAESDRAYYPSSACLRSHVRTALAKVPETTTDQDTFIHDWQEQKPGCAKVVVRKRGQSAKTTAADGSAAKVSRTIPRGGPRSQMTKPAQCMNKFKEDLTELLEELGANDQEPVNMQPEGRSLHAGNKMFCFDVGSDHKGVYLRVSEVHNNFRTAITIPEWLWGRFRDVLSEFVDKSNEKNSL